jgi:alkanesulfonate monooxygenase
VLIGYGQRGPDGSAWRPCRLGDGQLGFLIAHRPGFVAPTLTARAAATLDHVTNGRVALHIITGGSDAEQTRDGDWLDHDTRYRRTDEYLDVLRLTWTALEPFDHEGEFYRFAKAFSEVKPPARGSLYWGRSGAAATVAAKHCDVRALGRAAAAVKRRIADITRRPRSDAARITCRCADHRA